MLFLPRAFSRNLQGKPCRCSRFFSRLWRCYAVPPKRSPRAQNCIQNFKPTAGRKQKCRLGIFASRRFAPASFMHSQSFQLFRPCPILPKGFSPSASVLIQRGYKGVFQGWQVCNMRFTSTALNRFQTLSKTWVCNGCVTNLCNDPSFVPTGPRF